MTLIGLHHVTATVDDAQDDLDFCLGGLGCGWSRRPSTSTTITSTTSTTATSAARRARSGRRSRTRIAASRRLDRRRPGHGHVPVGAQRLARVLAAALGDRSIAATDLPARFGEPVLRFSDLSGLTFELIGTSRDDRTPWVADGFDPASAVRGLHSVTMVVREAPKTLELMTGLLGYRVVDESEHRIRLAVNGGGPGKTIDVAVRPDAERHATGSARCITSRWRSRPPTISCACARS
jgi:glyoxalase family protein